MNNKVKLRELEVRNYSLHGSVEFHKALSHQTSLEWLKLTADVDDAVRSDSENLVTAICALTNLKYLNLVSVSEDFIDVDIIKLAGSLSNLEELWVGTITCSYIHTVLVRD